MEAESRLRLNRRLSDSVTMELPGMVILTAILVFLFVVVFVLLLQLYAKWLWSRIEEPFSHGPENRRRRRRLDFSSVHDPDLPTLKRGLDLAVLGSIPVLIFQSENFKDGLECAVCLSEVIEGEKTRLLPNCFHGFHIECIDMWFQSHSTCPLCRNPVEICQPAASDELPEENSAASNHLSDSESPNFPTNVLFWGNQGRATSAGACLEEGPSHIPYPASSSTAATVTHPDSEMVIELRNEMHFSPVSSSVTATASRSRNEERKLPVTTRLRSLKRLFSREKRINPCNPTSTDAEMQVVTMTQS